MSINVLYIHHCGSFGGSSRSLLEMITALPQDSVKPCMISPGGSTVSFFTKLGVPVIKTIGISLFDITEYGYYKKLRWLILLRELFFVFFTVYALIKAKNKWKDIDVIHVNEIMMLLPIILAKFIFKKPIVVHTRLPIKTGETRFRIKMLKKILNNYTDALIAIDHTVKNTFPSSLSVEVIHNGFDPRSKISSVNDSDSSLLSLPKKRMRVGIVGNLIIQKGVYEFVEAAKLCIDKSIEVDFFIIGDNARDFTSMKERLLKRIGLIRDVKADIIEMINKYNLKNNVHFVGFTADVGKVYSNIDVLCFPSYYNAAGRPVFEAAYYKVPGIVAVTHPLEDTVINKETGICVTPKNANEIADAIEYFFKNPSEIKRMGENAYQLALKNFDVKKNALKMLNVYHKLLNSKHTTIQQD